MFTGKPRQQPFTEASTGVDHECKPWRHKSIWREWLLLSSWFSLRNSQENIWRLLHQRKEIGARKGLHRVHLLLKVKAFWSRRFIPKLFVWHSSGDIVRMKWRYYRTGLYTEKKRSHWLKQWPIRKVLEIRKASYHWLKALSRRWWPMADSWNCRGLVALPGRGRLWRMCGVGGLVIDFGMCCLIRSSKLLSLFNSLFWRVSDEKLSTRMLAS